MQRKRSTGILLGGAAAFVLVANQANAQAVNNAGKSPENMSMNLEEVVVTAQRRPQPLQDVPVSVSVVTGNQLASQGIHSLGDLAAHQPDLMIQASPSSDQLRIRGSGSGNNPGFEQSVATFVDGIYRSRSRSTRIALFDIKRVEILRGPQTTFFGANAIAGALNITTRRPHGLYEGNASALYSPSDGEYDTEAGVSVPLTDTWGVRLAGRWAGMDGYLTTPGTKFNSSVKGPHKNDMQFRVSTVWKPTSNVKIYARYDYANLDDKNLLLSQLLNCPAAGGPVGQCARTIFYTRKTYPNHLSTHSTNLFGGWAKLKLNEFVVTGTVDLGPASIISTTGYQHQQYSDANNIAPFPYPSLLGTNGYLMFYSQDNLSQVSEELRIQSNGSRFIDYMAGFYYQSQDLKLPYMGLFYFAPLGAAAAPTYNFSSLIASDASPSQTSTTYSGFASITVHPTSRLKLTGGIRYSSVEKNGSRSVVFGTNTRNPTFQSFVPGPQSVQGLLSGITGTSLAPYRKPSIVEHEWMPSGSISYNFSHNIATYASYARGFKAGGFSTTTPDVFGPEHVNAYEVGLKAQWFDHRVTTNMDVFRSDYKGLQDAENLLLTSGAIESVVANVAASRSQGVEFNGNWNVNGTLRIETNVAYLDAQYTSFPNAPCSPVQAVANPKCLLDLSGKQQSYAPQWSGSVTADQVIELPSDMILNLGATVYFTSSFYTQTTDDPLLKQGAYTKLDLRASLSTMNDHLKFAVIAKNVTNKLTAGFRNYVPAAIGSSFGIVDRPRSIALQVSYSW